MCNKKWLESEHFEAESRAFIGFYRKFPDEFKVIKQNEINKITDAVAEVNPKVNSTSKMSFFSDYRHDFDWDEQSETWKEIGAGCDIGFPIKWNDNSCWLGIDPFSIMDNEGDTKALKYEWTDNHVTGKTFKNVERLEKEKITQEHRFYVGLAHDTGGYGVTEKKLRDWCKKMGKCKKATEDKDLVGTFVILRSDDKFTIDKVVYLTNKELLHENAVIFIKEIKNIYVYDLNSVCKKEQFWKDLNQLYKNGNEPVNSKLLFGGSSDASLDGSS